MGSTEKTSHEGESERDDLMAILAHLLPAQALGSGNDSSEVSPQLARLIAAWPNLPQAAKDEIDAVVRTHSPH